MVIFLRRFIVFIKFVIIAFLIVTLSASWTSATTDCDKVLWFVFKGKSQAKKSDAYRYYKHAIDLCPGFIRPYELIGNLYRKDGKTETAIEFFTKAAELGTTNYKLYYLLASLLFQKGDLDEASRNLKKSLSIRGDYPKALELNKKIDPREYGGAPLLGLNGIMIIGHGSSDEIATYNGIKIADIVYKNKVNRLIKQRLEQFGFKKKPPPLEKEKI